MAQRHIPHTPSGSRSEQPNGENTKGLKESRGSLPDLATSLRDQLIVLGLLLYFAGVVSAEAYYGMFAVKYQFLSLSSSHIVYRGLTVLRDAPYLLIPYATALAILIAGNVIGNPRWWWFERARVAGALLLSVVVVIASYPLARKAGLQQARADMTRETTTLPAVILGKDEMIAGHVPEDEFRVLLIDQDYIIVFEPHSKQEIADGERPNIIRFRKGDIHVLRTSK